MPFKLLTAFLALLLLSACTGSRGNFDVTKPLSLDLRPPPGPVDYRQGWSDGCESSLAATGDKVQMLFGVHRFTYSEHLRYDFLYATAWRYAYEHCGYSMRTLNQYKYL